MPTPQIRTSIHGRQMGLAPDGSLIVNGARVSNAEAANLWKQCPSPNDNDPSRFFTFFDDFLYPASATVSDTTAFTVNSDGATGTNAFRDEAGGIINIVTAAADNDYQAISSVAENWRFAAGKELWLEARFRLAEATTNQSAWWFGLTDTLTTGGFQADAAGPLASFDGALVWKDEATMTIDFETSNAASGAVTTAMATFVSNTWTKVGFYFDGDPDGNGVGIIYPFVDVGAGWISGTPQNLTLAGLEEMHLVAGVKAGPTGAAETLQIDYLKVVQVR